MADITLSDYTGFLFREVVKAREMIDDYSRSVAQSYAQDPVLQHFPAPRFKLPKLEMNVPVVVTGMRFSRVVRFGMPLETFLQRINARTEDAIRTVRLAGGTQIAMKPKVRSSRAARSAARSAAVDAAARDFHQQLVNNPEPQNFDTIVQEMWARVLNIALVEQRLVEVYRRTNPRNELLVRTTADLRELIAQNTVVDRTAIDSMLVDPETVAVKSNAADGALFTIRLEMVEEGVQVRSVRDDTTGEVTSIVDFD